MAEPARPPMAEPARPPMAEPARPPVAEPARGPAAGQPGLRRGGEAALAAAVERLARLVRLESPSGDVTRLGALRDVLADRLAELGGTVQLVPGGAGDHVRAAFPAVGGAPAGGHILVVGHYDTVWEAGWLASHPFTQRDLVASGPGVLDMKGAIVALELAFELLKDSGRAPAQPVQVVLVADEEVSSPHGRTAVMDAAAGAAAVVGLEPPHPDGGLKTGRRGVARVRLEVHGREAHAGLAVAGGVSAIDELLDQLVRLRDALPRADDLGWNIGRVTGGTRANVVAGRASAEIGLRFATRQTERAAFSAVRSLTPVRPGARVTAEILSSRPAWPATPGNPLAEHVIDLAAGLGERLGARPAGGAGDTNFTGAAGLPTVDGLGPRGRGAHSPAESVRVDSILRRAELLAVLFSTPLPPLAPP
jgi:glutamate carboxypeptidase